ncbi:MAG: Gfo/Idh/MocA family oxidoreductase, partial [Acidimicrobiia bacterium]
MDSNPVIEMMGRRLRLAVIGGGPGSFIGETHRIAAGLDDRYELVAGAISSDPDRSRPAGVAIGLPEERSYGEGLELLSAEVTREDGAEVVAIMTPNDTHHLFSAAALDLGFDVICD